MLKKLLENTVIKHVTETKFVGILIGHHFSGKPHFSLVSKKISKSIGIIAKVCFYLSSKTLLSSYYSLVYPYLTYCNVACSSTYCSDKVYLPFPEAHSAADSKS